MIQKLHEAQNMLRHDTLRRYFDFGASPYLANALQHLGDALSLSHSDITESQRELGIADMNLDAAERHLRPTDVDRDGRVIVEVCSKLEVVRNVARDCFDKLLLGDTESARAMLLRAAQAAVGIKEILPEQE